MTSIGVRQIEFLDRNRTISTTYHIQTLNDMNYVNMDGETNHPKHTNTHTQCQMYQIYIL